MGFFVEIVFAGLVFLTSLVMAIISMAMIDYKTFRWLLQVSGCEEAFNRALYQYDDYTVFDEALWEAGDAEYIFAHAFDWNATPEGREY